MGDGTLLEVEPSKAVNEVQSLVHFLGASQPFDDHFLVELLEHWRQRRKVMYESKRVHLRRERLCPTVYTHRLLANRFFAEERAALLNLLKALAKRGVITAASQRLTDPPCD